MILKMDSSKITIKELTQKAGIHRKTFYLHYACIEDLLNDLIEDIFEDYQKSMDQLGETIHICKTNHIFFTFFSSQESYVEKMLCDLSYQKYILPHLWTSLQKNRERYNPFPDYSKDILNIVDLFIVEGTLLIYRQWVKDEKKVPLETVIDLSSNLLENGLSSIRQK